MLLITISSPAHAAATLNENGQLQAPTSDIREILNDNAALLAEIDALKQSLNSEREATRELIESVNKYRETVAEEIALKDERIANLEQQVTEYQTQVRTAKRQGTRNTILGVVLAIAVACVL
ncbi:MAG: hypothetical protein LUJ25_05595 [Firmicutes bacterium]|nr:hypothetical protein [Bacillota bacterium]